MKLYYYQMSGGNVGDDLNALLWPQLIPALATIEQPEWLIGIGTILNQRLDAVHGTKVVMGSGYRPGSHWRPPRDLHFAAVRGHGTAAVFGLDASIARCDPGFLIGALHRDRPQGDRVGFVPHVHSEDWSDIAHDAAGLGLDVISPRLTVDTFIARLQRCSRVFCESMHGAIFADALRIPWARVRVCSHYYERPRVSEFKWQDAFSVLGITAAPVNRFGIVPLAPSRPTVSHWLSPLRRASERHLARELKSRSDDTAVFQLSDAGRLEECTAALLQTIRRFNVQQRIPLRA